MKDKKIKVYIINKDISIFEIIEYGFKVYQVYLDGESGTRYMVEDFTTIEEAREYINSRLLKKGDC